MKPNWKTKVETRFPSAQLLQILMLCAVNHVHPIVGCKYPTSEAQRKLQAPRKMTGNNTR